MTGLAIGNSRVSFEAIFSVESGFIRTPKYAIGSEPRRTALERGRRSVGWVAYVELLAGTYFAAAVAFAWSRDNYGAVPFFSLFLLGFLGTGATMFYQRRLGILFRKRFAQMSSFGKQFALLKVGRQ